MADDDPYRWLDRAAAERLLSGEPLEPSLESVSPEARDQAELLAKTLGALSVDTPPGSAELPGEAAALAAFRKARPAPDVTTVAPATATPSASDLGSDMGLVRVGGFGRSGASHRRGARAARWGRPLRLGLGAALTVGMVGSVAMAAGVGVLPNPFGGHEPGRPAATVSADASRDPMLGSPSPDVTGGKGVPSLRPDSTAGGSFDKGTAGGDEPEDSPTGTGQGSRTDPDLPGDRRSALALSCRDIRSGKKLEAERRRALEKAAKGSKKVSQYCEDTLRDEPDVRSNADTGTGTGTGSGSGAGGGDTGAEDGQNGAGDTGGQGNGLSGDNGDGNGDDGGNGHGSGNGGGHGSRAAAKPTPTPTTFTALRVDEPQYEPGPDPDPSYGVLPLPTAT
ncbi:hypothetical protein [Streptomyces sp. SID12501]|uniref:Extensin n=1 Tax=Streptomyces sp. SID12501 TaxID=2706042 RepID=A0A6B3C533_9ACTN|nr:hypothetical protein [Streptomyces sp. SID12501]NEC91506.1 hypothetical protein [Streptomyces sp. SID12501]